MFVASEGSVEWCRGGSGVWIYPSSRIDRVGRIYGACVCVRRRWLCCIARSRRAVHFRGGRSVVAVRPGDVIYQTDGNVIPPRLYTPVPTDRGWRPRPPLYMYAQRPIHRTIPPRRCYYSSTTLPRNVGSVSRRHTYYAPITHARIVRDTIDTAAAARGYHPHVPRTIYHYHYFYF